VVFPQAKPYIAGRGGGIVSPLLGKGELNVKFTKRTIRKSKTLQTD